MFDVFPFVLCVCCTWRVDSACWSGRWDGVCTHAWEFHRQSNGKEKPSKMASDEGTIRIDISRNSSRHMSCSRLREQQEREEQDGTQNIAYAKRKLDAMWAFYTVLSCSGINSAHLQKIRKMRVMQNTFSVITSVRVLHRNET